MNRAKLLQSLTRSPEVTKDSSIEFELVNFSVVEIGRSIGIGAVEVLMRAWRNTDRSWHSNALDVFEIIPVVVEHVNSFVAPVASINVARRVYGKGMNVVQLAVPCASTTPSLDVISRAIELDDARVARTIGDEDVSLAVPRNVCGPTE